MHTEIGHAEQQQRTASSSSTSAPLSCRRLAAARPAIPAPITTTRGLAMTVHRKARCDSASLCTAPRRLVSPRASWATWMRLATGIPLHASSWSGAKAVCGAAALICPMQVHHRLAVTFSCDFRVQRVRSCFRLAVKSVTYKYVKIREGAETLWEDGYNRCLELKVAGPDGMEDPDDLHEFDVDDTWRESGLADSPTKMLAPARTSRKSLLPTNFEAVLAQETPADTTSSNRTSPVSRAPEVVPVSVNDDRSTDVYSIEETAASTDIAKSNPLSPAPCNTCAHTDQLHSPKGAFHAVDASNGGKSESSSRRSSDGSFDGPKMRRCCNSCLNCHGMCNAVPDCTCCPNGCGARFRAREATRHENALNFLEPPADAVHADVPVVVDIDHIHPKVVVVSHDEPAVAPTAAVSHTSSAAAKPPSPVPLTKSLEVEKGLNKPRESNSVPYPPTEQQPPVPKKKKGCCTIA